MTNGGERSGSAMLDLRLAVDQIEQLEANLEAESVGDVVETARTKIFELPSLSGTASQMKSLMRLNKLTKVTDRAVTEIAARCDAIVSNHPGTALEDGTNPNAVKARALYAKARLLISMIPAMNTFKRKKAYRDAMDILEESAAACPNQSAHLAIGFCLEKLKDRQGAAAAYDRCIALNDETEYALEAARRQRELGVR